MVKRSKVNYYARYLSRDGLRSKLESMNYLRILRSQPPRRRIRPLYQVVGIAQLARDIEPYEAMFPTREYELKNIEHRRNCVIFIYREV